MEIDHSALGLVSEAPSFEEPIQTEETATAAAESEPTGEEPTEEAKAGLEAEATGSAPYAFGGREWASQADAEQSFKSWEGRIQAEQAKVKDYESRLHEYWDYIQAVSKENQDFRSKAEKPEPKAEAKDEGLDLAKVQRLMEIAKTQGYDPSVIGMKALAQMQEERFTKLVDEKLSAVQAPLQNMEAQRQEATADRNMFMWAQGLKTQDGSPAYPELQSASLNENLVTAVHRVWKDLSKTYGPEYGYSAHGFDYAFRLAKDLFPQPDKPRDEQGRFIPSRAAASASAEVAGTQPNPVRPKRTESQRALDELAAIQPVKIGTEELGFYE